MKSYKASLPKVLIHEAFKRDQKIIIKEGFLGREGKKENNKKL